MLFQIPRPSPPASYTHTLCPAANFYFPPHLLSRTSFPPPPPENPQASFFSHSAIPVQPSLPRQFIVERFRFLFTDCSSFPPLHGFLFFNDRFFSPLAFFGFSNSESFFCTFSLPLPLPFFLRLFTSLSCVITWETFPGTLGLSAPP